MKFALLLLLIASTALAKPIPKAAPVMHGESPALVKDIPVAEIIQTLEHMRAIVSEQTHELDAARDDTASFRKQAQDATAQVLQAKGETSLLQRHIDDLTAWGIAEQAEKQKAEADLIVSEKAKKAAEAHVSSIKTWLGFALGAILALLVQQLPWSFVIPPWNLYGRIAGTALAFGLGWLIVARFV